jgi:hypothetical protein
MFMGADVFNDVCIGAFCVPFLAIAVILFHYYLRRALWKRKRRRGKGAQGFCPSSSALGMALLFMQAFYRPSVEYVIEEKLHEEVEEDDSGDPATPEEQLNRQLKLIRRGEPVDRLILRQ